MERHYRMPLHFLRRAKDYALPLTIAAGVVGYKYISLLGFAVPYCIIAMLFFSFVRVDLSKIRLTPVLLFMQFFQVAAAVICYFTVKLVLPPVVAEGALSCFLCPAASASPVIIGILGGSVTVGVSYVLFTSAAIALIAPLLFSWIAPGEMSFWASVLYIMKQVMPLVLIPIVLSSLVRRRMPRVMKTLSRIPSAAFWLWVVTLAIVIARTVSYMAEQPASEIPTMILLAVTGLVVCIIQFTVGKLLSKRVLGESITLGQSLGQKNSSLAIWMCQAYLNPLSAVAMAAYSIWQNLFNALQMMIHSRKLERAEQQSHDNSPT